MPPWLTLILMLLAVAVLLAGATVFLMARMLLRPRRMMDAKATVVLKRLSPGDLGLRFEETSFVVRDARTNGRIRIAAWWIAHPHARGRCAILVHGYGDAKVGAIAWAPTFHALGWNILAIDLRAHGESGGAASTAGYFERDDLNQVINDLRAARPDETRQIVLFGVSLGAAVAIATAVHRDDIAGIVLESPFARYRHAVGAHGHLLGMPGGLLREWAVRLAEMMSGADFDAVSPADLLPRVKCPVLLIQAGDDPFVPDEDQRAMLDAMRRRAEHCPTDHTYTCEAAGHVLTLQAEPERFARTLATFLESMDAAARSAESEGATVVPSVEGR